MGNAPLNSLRAIAAVWQEGGIRPAARALDVSPSAVHRHLKVIETYLGVAVSSGIGRAFVLTPEGERVARTSASSFERLNRAMSAAGQQTQANRVIVSLTETFAREWLIPRLGQFQADNPATEIWLRPDRRFADLAKEASFAIRMGEQGVVGETAIPWLDDRLVPVMSPGFAAQISPDDAACVARLPLLHDFDAQTTWKRYAESHRVDLSMFRKGMRVGSDSLAMDAAEAGLGVALARGRLAERRIEQGRLIALDQHAIDTGPSHWLVSGPGMRPAAIALYEWLIGISQDQG